MNLKNKPKQISAIAESLRVAEWQIHEAAYKISSWDSNTILKHFEQKSIENRLSEMTIRVEEMHMYLMSLRTITSTEFNYLNVRIAHMKEDCRSLSEEFLYIKPNLYGKIVSFINQNTPAILAKNLTPAEFLEKIEFLMSDVLKNIKNEFRES